MPSKRPDRATSRRIHDAARLRRIYIVYPERGRERAHSATVRSLAGLRTSTSRASRPHRASLTTRLPSPSCPRVRREAGAGWALAARSPREHGEPPYVATRGGSPNGNTWTSVYDGSLLKRVDTSPEGRTTTTLLDANGKVLSEQRGALTPIEFAYDEHGRLQTITQGTRVTTNSYYASGETKGYLETITNALSQTTTFTPDALGHVLSQVEPGDVETQFTWDENSNLSSVTPPGKPTHVQTYTPVDQLETYVPPVLDDVPTPQTTYTYNHNHQLTSMVRPDGVTLTQSYDTAGRLSLITMPTGTILHGYYGTTPCTGCTPGSLMRMTGPGSNALDFTYDGSLLSSTTWSGAINGAVQWTHDNDFRIATETVVPSGDTITYRYDKDGLTTCASKASCTPPSTDALKLTYSSSNGLLAGAIIGNLTEAFTYNSLGELATHTASYSGTPIYSGTFHSTGAPRDELGRIKRKVETVLGTTRTDGYEYDDHVRLLNVARNSTLVAEYDYDANGNRLSLTNPDTSSVTLGGYDDQDRMLTYGSFEYTYNANGDLVSKTNTATSDTTTYEYDARGALINVVLPDSTNIDYVIDGQSRRIQKVVNGTPVQGFLYKDQLKISAELDASGNVVSRFVYVDPSHSPDFMIKGGNVYRFIKDQLGSPRVIIDVATGTVEQELEYDEFGNVLNDTNPGFQPFGFAGELYDLDTGLVRFGARDYDPETGRWTAKDPTLFGGDQGTFYGYSVNNPINQRDPSGLLSVDDVCKIARTCQEECSRRTWDPISYVGCMTGCTIGASTWEERQPYKGDPRCEQVRNECVSYCSEAGLPAPGGGRFRRCMRDCMLPQGCDY